jgi:BirA family biotin operon repressor/biotin-[acetyl-CoA-carboxylase] ligase
LATSIRLLTGAGPDPAVFAQALADAFARWLGRWRGEGLAPIRSRWLAAAYPQGTALSAAAGEGLVLDGLFDGLEESGALRLRLADGSTRVIHAGDVFLIEDN